MLKLRLKASIKLVVLACLALTFSFVFILQPAKAQAPEGDQFIFLPNLVKGNSTTPPPPPPPPPPPLKGGVFPDTQWNTASAGIATDANGGMHLVYNYYESAFDEPPTYGVYLYCPADCEKATNWKGVGLGENVTEIQLALTPQGHPRVLFRSWATDNSSRNDFFYAACDGNCTQTAPWRVIHLTSNLGASTYEWYDDDRPQRYFALDPTGRPRFVYNDYVTGHFGTFYAFCDAPDCTQPATWAEVRINQDNGQPEGTGGYQDENYGYPALAFTPQGQPRIVADGTSLQDGLYLFYLACDAGCGQKSNWDSLALYDRGGGKELSYDVELDANGRSRIAFYQAGLLGGQGDRLSYAWCNNACLTKANWQRRDLGLGSLEGQEPDLELDTNGRPRIAYALFQQGGLGYSWCNSNCETPGAVWQHQVVESRTKLFEAWPIAYPILCNASLWDGLTPSLSLDKAGNPRIAYDTVYYARCTYIPETGEWKPVDKFHLIWRAVRVNYFPKP